MRKDLTKDSKMLTINPQPSPGQTWLSGAQCEPSPQYHQVPLANTNSITISLRCMKNYLNMSNWGTDINNNYYNKSVKFNTLEHTFIIFELVLQFH